MTQANNASQPPRGPKETAIAELLRKTGYRISHENGQRKYGPPPDWNDEQPAKGSEVFVGKIPRDLFEDELVPTFERIGKIFEIRLMMDYCNNLNRGYAFVTYLRPESAKKAIKELDNYEIRKGKTIGVCKSVDNCRLFVGGIPKSKTKEEIFAEMQKITDSVSDVILYSSIPDKSKNRGFAFVEYENHKAAAVARRKLMPGKIQLWGHQVAVDWAEPEIEVDEETMSKVTVLYIRNLMQETTEDTIKTTFSVDNSLKIDKVKKLRDFAFVHYTTREDAEVALDKLQDILLDGSRVEVTWAKPVDKSMRQATIRPISSSTVSTYPSPFVYGAIAMDPYIATFPTCATRGVLQRIPFARRNRGAAGIRRYRNNFTPPHATRTIAYKPVELPLPPPYSHQFQSGKLSRLVEEGKSYNQTDYHTTYASTSPNVEGLEPTMTSLGAPGLPYSGRLSGPAYVPVLAAYDENGYYSFVPQPPPPGALLY